VQLKAAFGQGEDKIDACQKCLVQLKILMLDFTSLPPAPPSAVQDEELLIAREALEYGALLAIKTVDILAFERQIAQLKTYYTDYAQRLPESSRQYPILGLNLLRLLAQNRIAEFHTELELLPAHLTTSNVYIKFPAQLEQHIMEGSYNKVLSAKQDGIYAQEGMYFMDMLVDTVREEIAQCSEKAYASIGASELQGLLMLGSEAELGDYAEERGWVISGGSVTFGGNEEKPLELPATQLIQETLAYAKELERIV
jgi:26S proteasome regulatory subunit N12